MSAWQGYCHRSPWIGRRRDRILYRYPSSRRRQIRTEDGTTSRECRSYPGVPAGHRCASLIYPYTVISTGVSRSHRDTQRRDLLLAGGATISTGKPEILRSAFFNPTQTLSSRPKFYGVIVTRSG